MPAQLESVNITPLVPKLAEKPRETKLSQAAFYYPQLDGLRTLAFLMVFGSHAGGFFPNQCYPMFSGIASVYNDFVMFGWSGVDLFFVLSAFLITSLLLREEQSFKSIDVPAFLLRRVLRIWPLYFLALAVGLAIFPLADPAVIDGGIRFGTKAFSNYIFANCLWGFTFTLNLGVAWGLVFAPANIMPLWSVSLEEQFYLGWSVLLKIVKHRALRIGLVLTLLACSIAYRSYLMGTQPFTHVPYYLSTFSRLDPLIMGALIAFGLNYLPKAAAVSQKLGVFWFIASMVVFKLTTTANLHIHEEHNPFALTLIAFAWGLFLLSALTFQPIIRVFSNQYVAAFGRLTYGMYIVHALVLNLIFNQIVKPINIVFPSNESSTIAWLIGLPLTFTVAWALWNGYEKRFYKLKDKFARVKSGYMMSTSFSQDSAARAAAGGGVS